MPVDTTLIGVVGDYNPNNHTHQATDAALRDASACFEWVRTIEVDPVSPHRRLGTYSGLMIAPSSPYESMDGALAAIRLARERGVPLVGT